MCSMLVLKSFFWSIGLQYFISASTGIQLSRDVTESKSHSTALITSTVSADVPFQQVQICLQNVQLWGRYSSSALGSLYYLPSEYTFGYESIYVIFLFLTLVLLVLVAICIRISIMMHPLPLINVAASTILSTFLFFLFNEQIFLIA